MLREAVLQTLRLHFDEVRSHYGVKSLRLFGSVARDSASEGSDVDLLVAFDDDADWSLLDLARMEDELEAIAGRAVDLVMRRSVEHSENWIRREAILASAEVIYGTR